MALLLQHNLASAQFAFRCLLSIFSAPMPSDSSAPNQQEEFRPSRRGVSDEERERSGHMRQQMASGERRPSPSKKTESQAETSALVEGEAPRLGRLLTLRIEEDGGSRNILIDLPDQLASELGIDPRSLTGQQERELAELVQPHLEVGQRCIDRHTLRRIVEGREGEVSIGAVTFTREQAAIAVIGFAALLLFVTLAGVFF